MLFSIVFIECLLLVTSTLNSSKYETSLKSFGLKARIMEAQDAARGQFPFQVSICGKGIKEKITCGGSIISEEYVLTAAQCTKGLTDISVFTNSFYYGGGKKVSISRIFIHPEYNAATGLHDIALIKVSKITFSDVIKSVRLATNKDTKYTGQIGITAGWGTCIWGRGTSRPLKFAEYTIISKKECENRLGHLLLTSELCADGKITEREDIGGAMILKEASHSTDPTQIGVLIRTGYPTMYLRVAHYISWIEGVIGQILNNDVA